MTIPGYELKWIRLDLIFHFIEISNLKINQSKLDHLNIS